MKLDSDIVDEICREALKDHMGLLKKQIKELKKHKGKLAEYQAQDLGNSIQTLDAMELVYDYFGGNVKWHQ